MSESAEVAALRGYMLASKIPHRVTSTYRKGPRSRHGAGGTDGAGLAVDFAGPTPDADGSPEMMAIAFAFLKVESALHELIYTPLGFSIKNGRRVAPYAIETHRNHVHVSVDRGVFVKWKEPAVADEIPTLTDLKFFVAVVDVNGHCTGYYMVSSTGEVHGHGPGAPYHGRSLAPR